MHEKLLSKTHFICSSCYLFTFFFSIFFWVVSFPCFAFFSWFFFWVLKWSSVGLFGYKEVRGGYASSFLTYVSFSYVFTAQVPDDEQFVPDFQSDSCEYLLSVVLFYVSPKQKLWLLFYILAALRQIFSPLKKSDSYVLLWERSSYSFWMAVPDHMYSSAVFHQHFFVLPRTNTILRLQNTALGKAALSLPPSILSLISRLAWGITWAKLLIWFHTFSHSGPAAEVG